MATNGAVDSGSGFAVQVQDPPRHSLRLVGFLIGLIIGLVGLSIADNGRVLPQTRVVVVESQSLANVALQALDQIRLHMPRAMAWHPAPAPKPVPRRGRHRSPDEAWYVFLPPGDPHHDNPDPSAPFKRWAQGEAFDSAESCESYRNNMLREMNHAMKRETEVTGYQIYLYRLKAWTYADCVSAQDQRIKEAR
jgi:hypothetical protein